MLILLYSDTNYVLDGFHAEFSVTDCPNNCTKHGNCINNTCVCEEAWGGKDCSKLLCPNDCGEWGTCGIARCRCRKGFSGQTCSLRSKHPDGNKWHWLSRSEDGLTARAAHTAIYDTQTDSFYIFGGYNLNRVLGDLEVYRFNTSRWEDHKGKFSGSGTSPERSDPTLLGNGLERIRADGHKYIISPDSFVWKLSHSINGSSSGSSIDRATSNSNHYRSRESGNISGFRGNGRTVRKTHKFDGIHPRYPKRSKYRGRRRNSEGLPLLQAIIRENDASKTEFIPRIIDQNPDNSSEPSPRYGHAACKYELGFVIYGGKLDDGTLSNELWHYDVGKYKWTLRARSSSFHPPSLTRHTLTLGGDRVYVFGGSTVDGGFSSSLYSIKLNLLDASSSLEEWMEIQARGGKELDVRVVAHSTVYHEATNSLVVYGGVVASVARFSKLSDRMFVFQLNRKVWSEIHYSRELLPDIHVPRERAFHTGNIIGNYLVVFGGYSHRHNREEICYDNQMYLYNLGCHVWVSHEVFGSSDGGSKYPKQQGVFAHAADVRNGNTLLLVGGYHGNVNADLIAYTLPAMLAPGDDEFIEPEQLCSKHKTLTECSANPECGWCSADEICYGRTIGSNCTTNLQTSRCPGICPVLDDCHSCLIHGQPGGGWGTNSRGKISISNKLNLGTCTWCVQNARCHHKNDNYGVCGMKEDPLSQTSGWWGTEGTEITEVEDCREKDRRPGLTFLKYKPPVNFTQPDSVAIVNATTIDFNVPSMQGAKSESALGGVMIAKLTGFLRTPQYFWHRTEEHLKICVSYNSATLRISHHNNSSFSDLVVNLTAETSQCIPAMWKDGDYMSPEPGRYLLDFESKRIVTVNYAYSSKMEIIHNRENENPRVFTFEYLEPYQNGSCSQYRNCLHCLTDSSCGWCDIHNLCLSRSKNEVESCSVSPDGNKGGHSENDWHYLIITPTSCANCSNYISCESCVRTNLCEWWTEEARCARVGRLPNSVLRPQHCPIPCRNRSNCTQCLENLGRCVWCEATEECFSFSVYTSEYQFGLCREWIDQAGLMGVTSRSSLSLTGSDQCKSCDRHVNCTTCLHSLSCGWCYKQNNPITGFCVRGDFSRAHVDCNSFMDGYSIAEKSGWAYAECPDLDECSLDLHDCHHNADCINTHGSYSCECKRGFNGDGKNDCTKTCYEKCINGYCSNGPDYICECTLGWSGPDCQTDCGCYNHSTCIQSIGTCDRCQNWTTGERCERCEAGSYGNATTNFGCHKCDCNGHGSENLNFCDHQTGRCFCKDNTEGKNCQICRRGYYGDPQNGKMCYYGCSSRGVLNSGGTESQGLGSQHSQLSHWGSHLGTSLTEECLWIVGSGIEVSSETMVSTTQSVIQLSIHDDINISCQDNSVYVYDGLPDFISFTSSHQSQLLGVFCMESTNYPITVEARSGILTVHYKQSNRAEGFNASYIIMACNNSCPSNRECWEDVCLCNGRFVGIDCDIEVCPNDCGFWEGQGRCDKSYGHCVCVEGRGGRDCAIETEEHQLVFTELFNSEYLADHLDHLRKTLPRFGHSLVADRRGSLWMFGGYSLSHGALNDIRLFDTKNNTWVPVTVESTSESSMPQGRYFHAAEMIHSRQQICIYGGLTVEERKTQGLSHYTLSDFWKFSLQNQRWTFVGRNSRRAKPPPLAGHTLTLRRKRGFESLILIGGFSHEFGYSDKVWEFNLDAEIWNSLETTGNEPPGVYGHTAVYHAKSDSLYVFGGNIFSVDRTSISDKLYALNYHSRTWSVLPPFNDEFIDSDGLPQARFLHSAVTTEEYMVIFGGQRYPYNTNDSLIAYKYACNLWVRLIGRDMEIIGEPPSPSYAHAMTHADSEINTIYVVGGFDGGIQCHVTRMKIPEDLCNLWVDKSTCEKYLDCSFCSMKNMDGEGSPLCFSKQSYINQNDKCNMDVTQSHRSNGIICDSEWMSSRKCQNFKSCSECLAEWPLYHDDVPTCKWCSNCLQGQCIPLGKNCEENNRCSRRQLSISNVNHCRDSQCFANDCEKCRNLGNGCTWTRKIVEKSKLGWKFPNETFYDWNCVSEDVLDHSSIRITSTDCGRRCSEFKDCMSCLSGTGSEGGWHVCKWSTRLSECFSLSYQPLYCTGGVCGLVLDKSDIGRCPEPCSFFKQCRTCLEHSHCGWCSLNSSDIAGRGICTEGSLKAPNDHPTGNTCDLLHGRLSSPNAIRSLPMEYSNGMLYENITSIQRSYLAFSWHYVHCPPENECINGHHTCSSKSEKCFDLTQGYECICGDGYKAETSSMSESRRRICIPMCTQGCVHGVCIEPNICRCNFGYVGTNCSIQCLCNGHSECVSPTKLHECIKCYNNTMGPQCDKCEPLFVGNPVQNGKCIPCSKYCNGHTRICINGSMTVSDPNSVDKMSVELLTKQLIEGPITEAKCVNCGNNTRGDRCSECVPGYFRGTEDLRGVCRRCECHGHGYTCDPVTGERCNCGNNTENEPSCISGPIKGSNNGGIPCWMSQCNKCRENYAGTPTMGRQCYKTVTVDSKMCFDSKLIDECKMRPKPLNLGHTVFYMIQPRFMNVNIRVIVDVTQGALDFFLSPRDDTFIVKLNSSTGHQDVELDSRFKRQEDHYDNWFEDQLSHRVRIVEFRSHSYFHINNATSTKPNGNSGPQYILMERFAEGLVTFITIELRNTIVVVRNLTNRLVLTLPQDKHELGQTKFHIALRAIDMAHPGMNDRAAYGMIFFRQDQLHIDLFVFFSVFFSCFFLFLAMCVVAWKAKQAADVRRARRQHVVEMLHMAKRPFAFATILYDQGGNEWSPSASQQKSRRNIITNFHSDVRPLAIEPTDDGIAAIATVFIGLPGDREAPIKLALGSSLILLTRVYPVNSRVFLRRRNSHALS